MSVSGGDINSIKQSLARANNNYHQEKSRAEGLANLVNQKEHQLQILRRNMGIKDTRIKEMEQNINKIDSNEVNQLKGQMQRKEETMSMMETKLRNLQRQKDDMERFKENKIKDLEMELEKVMNKNKNEISEILEQKKKEMNHILSEKDNSNSKLIEMKDQQVRQLQDNLEFFKKQTNEFKIETQRMKESAEKRVEELENILHSQNKEMKMMKDDMVQLEKIIEDKDSILRKIEDYKIPGRE